MNNVKIITNLENINRELEDKISLANEEVLRVDEAQKFISEIGEEIGNLLPKDSFPYRKFERLSAEWNGFWKVEKRSGGYITKGGHNCQNLIYWHNIIKKILNEYVPEFLQKISKEKIQFIFEKGDSYKGKKIIFDIMKKATKLLTIIDPYLDEEVFNYIESLNEQILIRLMTSSKKKIFKNLLDEFKKIRPNVEARESHVFHDRYLIVDDTEIWHLGASINGIGKKAFQINKLGTGIFSDTIKKIELWWLQGNEI